MTNVPDEARLTAFALGELDDPDRAEIEARLANDPELQAAVAEIRSVAGMLEDELAGEKAPQLTELQRAQIEAAAAGKPRRSSRLRQTFWISGAVAAMLLVGYGVAFWLILGPRADAPPSDGSAHQPITCAVQSEDGLAARSRANDAEKLSEMPRPVLAVRKTRPGPESLNSGTVLNVTTPGMTAQTHLAVRPAPMLVPTPAPARPAFVGTPKSPTPKALLPSKTERLGPGRDHGVAPGEGWNREAYDGIVENPFRKVTDHPLSTFSIDVDTASYAVVRRMLLGEGRWPVPGAVRIEEMINYFAYDYAGPAEGDEHPFAARTHVARCPWDAEHRLVRIALKGRQMQRDSRPSSNFVFLLDVSGSMRRANKLPYVKDSMKMLVEQLGENDTVAIAVYAGASGLVLDATTCDRKRDIIDALERLNAGGSTNGGAGIELAYKVAEQHFIKGGVNRVILCTDGDFNVGVTSRSALVRLIEQKATSGVFLSVLGFGTGNYQDARMEKLADKGNGNYAYIDTLNEAKKVLVDQMSGTLVTIAKDVKIQVEFNPAKVGAYRLIGYENRMLRKEDFNDDTKDAGEIGAGHTVTALYEIVPAGREAPTPKVDPLKYQGAPRLTEAAKGGAVCTVKLRYKRPDADKSVLMTHEVSDRGGRFEQAPADFRFATAVAAFAMILRDSKHKGTYTLGAVAEQARSSLGTDPFGYRAEFVQLVEAARKLRPGS